MKNIHSEACWVHHFEKQMEQVKEFVPQPRIFEDLVHEILVDVSPKIAVRAPGPEDRQDLITYKVLLDTIAANAIHQMGLKYTTSNTSCYQPNDHEPGVNWIAIESMICQYQSNETTSIWEAVLRLLRSGNQPVAILDGRLIIREGSLCECDHFDDSYKDELSHHGSSDKTTSRPSDEVNIDARIEAAIDGVSKEIAAGTGKMETKTRCKAPMSESAAPLVPVPFVDGVATTPTVSSSVYRFENDDDLIACTPAPLHPSKHESQQQDDATICNASSSHEFDLPDAPDTRNGVARGDLEGQDGSLSRAKRGMQAGDDAVRSLLLAARSDIEFVEKKPMSQLERKFHDEWSLNPVFRTLSQHSLIEPYTVPIPPRMNVNYIWNAPASSPHLADFEIGLQVTNGNALILVSPSRSSCTSYAAALEEDDMAKGGWGDGGERAVRDALVVYAFVLLWVKDMIRQDNLPREPLASFIDRNWGQFQVDVKSVEELQDCFAYAVRRYNEAVLDSKAVSACFWSIGSHEKTAPSYAKRKADTELQSPCSESEKSEQMDITTLRHRLEAEIEKERIRSLLRKGKTSEFDAQESYYRTVWLQGVRDAAALPREKREESVMGKFVNQFTAPRQNDDDFEYW